VTVSKADLSAGKAGRGAFLSLDGISKHYGHVEVLRDVSLDVHQGEVVVLLGRSGSGKSTLLRCAAGLETINRGTIRMEDRAAAKPADVHGRIGFVFQQFNLFPHLTALENVTLGLRWVKHLDRDAARRRGLDALRDVGLEQHVNKKPANLSGGQQQRVAIARSVVMEPAIILFDEPTSALDRELVAEVLLAIRTLAERGLTMVIVTHELHFAEKVADRIVFMHEGRIIEQGPPAEVIAAPATPQFRQFLNALKAPDELASTEGPDQ
jgi:polar amino acid transport system ATP-binding protein